MSTESRKAVTSFLDSARLELEQTVNTMDIDSIQAAAVIIQTARKEKNRLHVTGRVCGIVIFVHRYAVLLPRLY